ncbi:alkene reductase [Arthrobacter sp. zg-Y1219]|uniref:alkene reductase n=1 Tax=Arthrobacter sp. zg-Y1219 TaxID=3049067 RepID=UPI0024C294D4|nr:alkene reductase [Arthrobacter sp. zg-Y1219]MDK1358948.1 alkene reductase [Arthrobacter sp. zg-Y1219]
MNLFSPLTVGCLELPNRLIMAPLTRTRSGRHGVPTALMAEHYSQRASMGLIVSEGTYTSYEGQGFTWQPGLVTEEQIAGWKNVTDAVHAAGGRIVAQVMHAGRVTHQGLNGGRRVVAPSAIAIDGLTHTYEGKQAYPVPHALTTAELPDIIDEFVAASRAAITAGFDGVELHSANGYLLHEFLSPDSNQRTDGYGGSPENRARFVIEAYRAVADAIGADRTGIRISPENNIQGVLETNPADVLATYTALLAGIAPLKPAFLSILHRDPSDILVQELRSQFGGPVLLNSGFGVITTREEALSIMEDNLGDGVVVGRPVIANPDLVRRWEEDLPLNTPDPSTFYSHGAAGYTDYAEYAEAS